MEPYTVTHSEKVFSGKLVDITHDMVTMPDGREALREIVLHGNAAAVVPIDDDGNVILVRQYRHATGGMALEIPAGMIEDGEDPALCASRELEEETGFKAGDLQFLSEIYTSIGFCNERISIYLARNLQTGTQHFDPDEFITVETYPLDKAVQMIFDGTINDSKTAMGIMAAHILLKY